MDAPKRGDSICTYKSYGYALFTYMVCIMLFLNVKQNMKNIKIYTFQKVIAQL